MTVAAAARTEPIPEWRMVVAPLTNGVATIREITTGDAAPLLRLCHAPEVSRHIARPPSTVDGFRRFARASRAQRRKGARVCFAVLPAAASEPVGIVQVWQVDPDFDVAEWGIVIARDWWGSGIAGAAAHLLFAFAFHHLGAMRLEARCSVDNVAARAFMRRLGAIHEGTLHRSVRRHDGTVTDQELWAIFPETTTRIQRHQAEPLAAEC